MRFIKAEGVPLLVTIFAAVMGIGGVVIGIQALVDPTTVIDFVDGADKMGIAWGGRNLGLGVAMIAAVLLRNSAGYAVGFASVIWREVSDLIAGLQDGGSLNVPFAVVLLIELVCLAIVLRSAIAMTWRPSRPQS